MRSLLTLLLAAILAAGTEAAETTRLAEATPTQVVLEGWSNVAPWRCSGTAVDALMVVQASPSHINAVIDRIEDGNIGVWMAKPAAGKFAAPDFSLRVPVAAFRCGNRIMEKDMRDALKASRFPEIQFQFEKLVGGIEHDLDRGDYGAEIAGSLSLAGVTKTIRLGVRAERVSSTRFRFRAELPVKMTDFGVTPPTALFGAIKARNDLKVRFDLVLEIASDRSTS